MYLQLKLVLIQAKGISISKVITKNVLKSSCVPPRMLILIKSMVQGALCKTKYSIVIFQKSWSWYSTDTLWEQFKRTVFIHYYSKYCTSKCFDVTKTFGGCWKLQAGNCPSVSREFHPPSSRVERGKVAQMSSGLQNKSFKNCHQLPAHGHGKMHSFLIP